MSRNLPSASLIFSEPREATCAKRLSLDTTGLSGWDSGLVSFLLEVESACRERGIQEDREGLPSGQKRLIEVAEAVSEKEGARAAAKTVPLLERVGDYVLAYSVGMSDFVSFFGDLCLAMNKLVLGKARYRIIDFMEVVQQCGPEARLGL